MKKAPVKITKPEARRLSPKVSSVSDLLLFLDENGLVLGARRDKPLRHVVTLEDATTGGEVVYVAERGDTRMQALTRAIGAAERKLGP